MTFIALSVEQVLALHAEAILRHGGAAGVRDLGLVESAVAQPEAAFAGTDFYPTVPEKAAALGFALVKNHAFIDGNKRVGFAALDAFLRVNGYKIAATTDEAEQATLAVAAGTMVRERFTEWVACRTAPLVPPP